MRFLRLIFLNLLLINAALALLARNSKTTAITAATKLLQKRSLLSKIIPVNVGLILDEQDYWVGQMGYRCIKMALSSFYDTHQNYNTRLVLHTKDYKHYDVISAASAAIHLINDVEVKAIIGPLTSTETQFVINLGTKAQVPIISYSATSSFLSSLGSPYFIRATQNDVHQVRAIGALIQAFGWKEVVPIHGNDEYGRGIMPDLVDMLQGINTRMPYQSVISPIATDDQILEELYKLKTMQTRVFIVHLWPNTGVRLFLKAKEAGMISEDYVWFLTNGMTDLLESFDYNALESMQGVLGVKTYVPRTQELKNFTSRWSMNFKHDHPNVYGLWAYDATFALAKAAEEAFVSSFNDFSSSKKSKTNSTSTDLDDIAVSNIGPKLLQAVSKTEFRGLAGDFSLNKEGELKPSIYQIINLVGNGRKDVGIWTAENGLMKDLKVNFSAGSAYSTSKVNLRAIIWPGDTFSVPKGWGIPASDKKLRIGVPVKDGFTEFVKVQKDPDSDTTKVTGYCIDVFDAVMAKLPYYVSYEYVPFWQMKETASSSYNDLTYQVYLGDYDAVVGDVTIVANRSLYIDYTLPFTESGVTMVVPVKENHTKRTWLFMKPLTWDLWVMTCCFFVLIAFIIWVLEHRVNEEFRGPPLHQAGTALYHSFSTMVFAHSENILSNPARFVMVVWIFVVLILTQSYTASLTSMLTVQQLQPAVKSINELIKYRDSVAYQQGSFVEGLLKQLGFKEAQLKPYKKCDELDDLLSKGSKNGGVSAVFDEVPYMRLFLAQHCQKYSMVQPSYKTGGFGFVFPKESPLVPDVSRAILSVTEGEKMVEIEKEWFNTQDNCDSSSSKVSYDYEFSLGLESFWGLFLIAGLAAIFALVLFLVQFMYKHWHIWKQNNGSIWNRVKELGKTYDEIDRSSPSIKKIQQQLEKSCHSCENHRSEDAAESMPNTNCHPSPMRE
ncbi:glutamate receptor 2.1-like [Chenopodium quinoa]|uniref:Glutamate receptor n=1 Tax=Chenopodium quinoa TaxID=63459 RepID=A0A803L5X0_CHEQI|nr:glutamate receptor 2.1-like [Chenopodium quinoa]